MNLGQGGMLLLYGSAGEVDIPPPGAVERPPPGAVDNPPPGAVDSPPPGAVDRPPSGAVDAPPPGAVDIPPPGAIESPLPGAVLWFRGQVMCSYLHLVFFVPWLPPSILCLSYCRKWYTNRQFEARPGVTEGGVHDGSRAGEKRSGHTTSTTLTSDLYPGRYGGPVKSKPQWSGIIVAKNPSHSNDRRFPVQISS